MLLYSPRCLRRIANMCTRMCSLTTECVLLLQNVFYIYVYTVLLYSPRCLRRIANMCRGKDAYIIPGIVGPDDLKVTLNSTKAKPYQN